MKTHSYLTKIMIKETHVKKNYHLYTSSLIQPTFCIVCRQWPRKTLLVQNVIITLIFNMRLVNLKIYL